MRAVWDTLEKSTLINTQNCTNCVQSPCPVVVDADKRGCAWSGSLACSESVLTNN